MAGCGSLGYRGERTSLRAGVAPLESSAFFAAHCFTASRIELAGGDASLRAYSPSKFHICMLRRLACWLVIHLELFEPLGFFERIRLSQQCVGFP